MTFNRPDKMMLCIYSDGTREGTMKALQGLLTTENPEDALLHKRSRRVLKKLAAMTDEEFADLEYLDALHYYIRFK